MIIICISKLRSTKKLQDEIRSFYIIQKVYQNSKYTNNRNNWHKQSIFRINKIRRSNEEQEEEEKW